MVDENESKIILQAIENLSDKNRFFTRLAESGSRLIILARIAALEGACRAAIDRGDAADEKSLQSQIADLEFDLGIG